MKVLIYSANFAPEPTGIGKYSGEMAAWLARIGHHQVRVVCAPPYYPEWKLQHGYRWPSYRRERWQGVAVRRAPLWVPREPGGLSRIIHLLTFAVTSCPLMLAQAFWRPDIVITVAPAFVCAPAGWLTARLCGAEAWLHLQDFEVDIAFQLGLMKSGGRLQRAILMLEKFLLLRFDSVSTISNRMVERLLQKGVAPDKARLFPNWVDTCRFNPFAADGTPEPQPRYRRELGIAEGKVVVLFSGSLGRKQGLMMIPEVARRLVNRSDLIFVICGDGVMKAELATATRDLPNVLLMPLQPADRVGELLCMADIHLLPQSPRAEDLVLPSKLSGMIASGRPVVATCRQGTELETVVSLCGVVVPPEDVEALATTVVTLADDAELRLKLGRRGRAWAEAHVERDAVLGRVFGMPKLPVAEVEEDAVAESAS